MNRGRDAQPVIGVFLMSIASVLVENGVEKEFLRQYKLSLDQKTREAGLNESDQGFLRGLDGSFRACLEIAKKNLVN